MKHDDFDYGDDLNLSVADRCRFLAAQGLRYQEVARRLGITSARAYSAIHVNKSSRMGRPPHPRCKTCNSRFCCHSHDDVEEES